MVVWLHGLWGVLKKGCSLFWREERRCFWEEIRSVFKLWLIIGNPRPVKWHVQRVVSGGNLVCSGKDIKVLFLEHRITWMVVGGGLYEEQGAWSYSTGNQQFSNFSVVRMAWGRPPLLENLGKLDPWISTGTKCRRPSYESLLKILRNQYADDMDIITVLKKHSS